MTVEAVLLAHVLLELAEAPAERDLLGRREPLVAKDGDLMEEEGVCDLRKLPVVQGTRQIDAADFCAEVPAELPDGDHGSGV